MVKIYKEDFKVLNDVFDIRTLENLKKISSKGFFDKIIREISLGKEANIFLAKRGEDFLILKIYRVNVMDFKKIYDYFRIDNRFGSSKRSRIDLINRWVKKEYRNLVRAYKNHVPVPVPIGSYKNILLLSFIGDPKTGEAAQRFKEISSEINNEIFWEKRFEETIESYKKLIDSEIIHGDLSEYNLLYENREDKTYFIDFSQSLTLDSHEAFNLFNRDIRRIKFFFGKFLDFDKINKGLEDLKEKFLRKF